MEAAENTHTSSYSTEQRRSGFSRSGVGFTVGSQKSSEQGHRQVTYHTGNTMAALNGNIRIHSSQGNVETPGSNLIAAGGIDVSGVNVDLGDVRDTAAAQQHQSSTQSGFSAGLNSAMTPLPRPSLLT
ncbi:MAG TPA: hemagglutinin repeat-containing protein [Xylella sp.]